MKYQFDAEIGEWLAIGNPAEWCPDFLQGHVRVSTVAAGPIYSWTCAAPKCPGRLSDEEPGANRDHYTWLLG
jgi:hypothetical protein